MELRRSHVLDPRTGIGCPSTHGDRHRVTLPKPMLPIRLCVLPDDKAARHRTIDRQSKGSHRHYRSGRC